MDAFQEALYMVVGFSFKSIFANDPADKKNVCHFNSGLNPFSDRKIYQLHFLVKISGLLNRLI